ncbi:MAG: phosphoheptose isomerase [Flavobacteriales bacterium]|nr:phosphoheptose isomerase [Flavobacteriales bacterium]HPJ51522.1 phosphoheptose isomerase [Flavobacteriales bacterium]
MAARKEALKAATDKEGRPASPVLGEGVKNFLIDIDGTVTEDVPNEEPGRMATVLPFLDALEVLNRWYEEGHVITFFTSRTEDLREVTEEWLDRHGFKYHGLLMGKPRGGNYHWIDNHLVRATRFHGRFTELVRSLREIEVFDDEDEQE